MNRWEPYFKPEARNKGEALIGTSKINLSSASDTEIQCYIRTSTSFKVVFRTGSISDPLLSAQCTCPQSKKQFCKHMWAALLTLEEKNPDFLEAKEELELSAGADLGAKTQAHEAYKQKQSDYRKQQYQIQKERSKERVKAFKNSFKDSKKQEATASHFPAHIENALDYFSNNGFPMNDSLSVENVSLARKKLAKVFHPDRGGSHDEILELNRNAETLLNYIE